VLQTICSGANTLRAHVLTRFRSRHLVLCDVVASEQPIKKLSATQAWRESMKKGSASLRKAHDMLSALADTSLRTRPRWTCQPCREAGGADLILFTSQQHSDHTHTLAFAGPLAGRCVPLNQRIQLGIRRVTRGNSRPEHGTKIPASKGTASKQICV
jgi:hypothetical protein